MLDPLPVPPFLRDAVQPLADSLHLKTLPLHIHEVLIAFVFYNLIDGVVSPYFSALLMGKTYREFPPRTRLQWNMHVTSTINAVILSSGAIYVLLHDNDRLNDTWEERLFGYTGLSGLVQAISAGYFFWDLTVSTANVKYLGAPDLIHAIVALTIAVLGFRPFGLYYGIQYVLLELSTPFANNHWFFNKTGMVGTTAQKINGLLLMASFFICRLIFGTWLTVLFFRDAWMAVSATQPSLTVYDYSPLQKPLRLSHETPFWVAATFAAANTTILALSAFWFTKMVGVAKKSFSSSGKSEKKRK